MANDDNKPNNTSTKRLQRMGLLNEKTVQRKEKDYETYFKEKVNKDRLIILNTLKQLKENQERVIVYQAH